MRLADTPAEAVSTIEAILEQCTAFNTTSEGLSEEAAEQLTEEVAASLLEEGEGPSSSGTSQTGDGWFTSDAITAGAAKVKDSLAASADMAGSKIMAGGEYLRQHISPNEQASTISPRTRER